MFGKTIKKIIDIFKVILTKTLLVFLFCYRYFISPVLGCNCRFYPTCSAYAKEAVQKYGIFHGGMLAIRRIFRCHPWCEGGCDPIPDLKIGVRRGYLLQKKSKSFMLAKNKARV